MVCLRAAFGQEISLPAQAQPFLKFAPQVHVHRSGDLLMVESKGLPLHEMMIGITAWQQQVPLPQKYFGANAWQIPLSPVPVREPASTRNRFLRGAVALAANGVPIFNPQNNRGEISAEIGELDQWGGHCGRADDYHYHAAPLHLQAVLGKELPIAYALDGYAIFGLTEPDGSAPAALDSINGHSTAALGYHYHASTKYPYVNGGFHGAVVERGEQVDPQPRAQAVRPALPPMRGARITGYESTGANSRKLTYIVNGETRSVAYAIAPDGSVRFDFQNGAEGSVTKTYGAGGSTVAPPAEQPNFILIMGEAQGWSSASVQMDDTVPDSRSSIAGTPNLEKLAAAGMRFACFYAASPRCTPTRAALLTGRSPAALRMTFVGEGGGGGGGESSFSPTGSKLLPAAALTELPSAETTIAEVLQRAGYATAHFGKWHVGRVSPSRHGFEESDGATNNGGGSGKLEAFAMTTRGIDFIERQAKAGKPFYLQLSHYPGRGGTDVRPETYAAVRGRVKDARLAGTAAMTEDMDATIGLLLEAVERLHLAGRTYIIYTSDHGALGASANIPLAAGKGTLWDGGIRVPLIVRGPGVQAGACSHLRATTIDLFPTIAELARIAEPLPRNVEGGSLAQVLRGARNASVKSAREEIVFHVPHYDRNGQTPASAILLGSNKLIHLYETGERLLFNIDADLAEQHDLASVLPQKAAELDQWLTEYLQAVGAQMPAPNPQFKQREDVVPAAPTQTPAGSVER